MERYGTDGAQAAKGRWRQDFSPWISFCLNLLARNGDGRRPAEGCVVRLILMLRPLYESRAQLPFPRKPEAYGGKQKLRVTNTSSLFQNSNWLLKFLKLMLCPQRRCCLYPFLKVRPSTNSFYFFVLFGLVFQCATTIQDVLGLEILGLLWLALD